MFTLADILEGTGGRLDPSAKNPDTTGFENLVIDSRQATSGSLFVALEGERVDGHEFVIDAIERGAQAALVRADWDQPDSLHSKLPFIRVADPLTALQRLAAWWRVRHDVQVIGITGSVGKTTTKEVVASVLSRSFDTLKSEGNFNNEIGLPLTLLRLTNQHKKAVLEMGAGYALGELTMLCEIARPEIAVVTMVHPVHLERMGTIERIAINKSELVLSLPKDGAAVLNGDDPRVRAMSEVTQARVLLYGLNEGHDLYATNIESNGLEGVQFTLHFRPTGETWPVKLPLLGRHNVYSALAAAGVAHAAGMPWNSIVDALQLLDVTGRMQVVQGYNGSTILDDCYNAAPASTIAALDLLGEMPGRHIAVLGDMLELGSYEQEGHREVGRHVPKAVECLVALGSLGKIIGEEALRCGMSPDKVAFANNNRAAISYLKSILQPDDQVLIKGSRGLRMEEIVNELKVQSLKSKVEH